MESIFDYLPRFTNDFEVIIVDDGSQDNTAKITGDLKSVFPNLKVVHHLTNRGYAAAIISGIKNSTKDFVLMMDSDRQFNIAELSKFIPYAQDYDIVAGFRIKRSDPFYRFLLGAFFNWLTNIIFNIDTKDINCGFKLFKGGLVRNMNLISEGALINAEIFFLAKKAGARIKEIGVAHYPRIYGRQTGANIDVIFKVIFKVLQLRFKLFKTS